MAIAGGLAQDNRNFEEALWGYDESENVIPLNREAWCAWALSRAFPPRIFLPSLPSESGARPILDGGTMLATVAAEKSEDTSE